jgi:hypothetical protein
LVKLRELAVFLTPAVTRYAFVGAWTPTNALNATSPNAPAVHRQGTNLISRALGNWFLLAEILTSAALDPTRPNGTAAEGQFASPPARPAPGKPFVLTPGAFLT